MTFATSVIAGGSISATAGESGTVDTDNLTVNAFVTLQSTGAGVTLQAGDDVVIGDGANLSANGVLTLTAGHNDTDGDGGLSIDTSALLVGNPINLSAINDVAVIPFSAVGSAVNVTSTGVVSLTDSGAYTFGALAVTGASINLGATISTTGAQTYNSPVVLTDDTILSSTGGGNVTFNSTVNGLLGLTVNTGGTTAFNGIVGGTAGGDRLGSLTTDAGGSTAFNISTSDPEVDIQGDANFGDDVTIGGGGQRWNLRGDTTFDGTIISSADTILQTRGTLTFNDAATFSGLQITHGGQIVINGGAVTTTTNNYVLDMYNDVVLGADTVITSNGLIRFRDTLDGAFALTLNADGLTEFRDVVGGTTPLASITTDAPGTTLLNGGSVTLSGNTLTFNDPVTLAVDTLITDAGAVTFNNTVDGAFALTVAAGGDVSFNGASGGTTPLASLGVGSDGQINIDGAITTANGNVTFGADAMAIAAAVNAGTGVVTLTPMTAGLPISLGAEVVGSLSLTDTELDFITASILRVGDAGAGTIDFSGLISLAPAQVSTLSLITGDQIRNSNGGTDVQVANLALQAVNGIGNDSQIDMDVDTVAAENTTEGGIAVIESFNGGDLVVGTVDGVVGIRNTASAGFSPTLAIQLETNNGDLTVNNDIFTSRRNMFLVAQQGNGGSGDRRFTNNANIVNDDGGGNPNNARIDVRANNMTLSAGSTISAANRVILEDDPSSTATIAIDLGGADGANLLGLTDAELDTVTTSTLQIGHKGSGNIDVVSPIDLTDGPDIPTTELVTGGTIEGNGCNLLTANSLKLNAAQAIGPSGNDFAFNATELTTLSANEQFLSEADSVTIGDDDLSGGGGGVSLVSGTFITTDSGGDIQSFTGVANSATLAGSGDVNAMARAFAGGTVSPGTTGPGIIDTDGLRLDNGSSFDAEVNGVTTAGTDYDQLNVAGTVTIDGATLNTSGTVSGTGSGDTVVLINNDGADPVSGTFAGLTEGADVTINGELFRISYNGGDGNDVVLVVPNGTINIVKDTVPDGGQDFEYTTTGGLAPATFSLDDDADGTLSNTQTFTVAAGSYTVSETAVASYTTSLNCVDPDNGTTTADATATIDLDPGETITCTFTNQEPGTITIIKDTAPDAALDFEFSTTGGLTPATFSLDDDADATLPNTRTFNTVPVGSYTVSETAVAGYTTTLSCTDPSGGTSTSGSTATIDLGPGETVTCTFTNTAEPNTIVIIQDTVPNGPEDFGFSATGGLTPATFTLDDDADGTLPNTQTFNNVAAGTYSIAQMVLPGYGTGVSCVDPSGNTLTGGATASIELENGELIRCTFSNSLVNAVPEPGSVVYLLYGLIALILVSVVRSRMLQRD